MRRQSPHVLRLLFLVLVLAVPFSTQAQEIKEVNGKRVFFPRPADSVQVEVDPVVQLEESGVGYRYTLHSGATSSQNIFRFLVQVPRAHLLTRHVPEGWVGILGAQDQAWRRIFPQKQHLTAHSWGNPGGEFGLSPNATQHGFGVTSDWLPGRATYWVQGYTPVPKFPNEAHFPDSVANASLFENSVSGTTIGPAVPPEEADEPAEILAQMGTLLTFSCERGWIDNRGICTSLRQKLRQVRQSLRRGQQKPTRNQMGAFLQELEAQRGTHVNESAYSVLALYARRFLDRV